jgi:hypothetical protein
LLLVRIGDAVRAAGTDLERCPFDEHGGGLAADLEGLI